MRLSYSPNVFSVEIYKYNYAMYSATSVSEGIVTFFFREEIYNLYYFKHQKTA
jgi:hypothetical protein